MKNWCIYACMCVCVCVCVRVCRGGLTEFMNAIFRFCIDIFQVLNVLCSLCVGNGVAVRSNQNLICENLLPGRDLLLQSRVVDYVYRLALLVPFLDHFKVFCVKKLFLIKIKPRVRQLWLP